MLSLNTKLSEIRVTRYKATLQKPVMALNDAPKIQVCDKPKNKQVKTKLRTACFCLKQLTYLQIKQLTIVSYKYECCELHSFAVRITQISVIMEYYKKLCYTIHKTHER